MIDRSKEFQVIGSLVLPEAPTEKEIAAAFYKLYVEKFWELLRPSHLVIRPPSSLQNIQTGWHQSAGRYTSQFMALWSNMHPSEVLLGDGHIVRGEPGDVILINNYYRQHRAPTAAVGCPDRWYATSTAFTDAKKLTVGIYK